MKRGGVWTGLLASTVLAGSAMAAPPTKVEGLDDGSYLEVDSNSRSGDLVSFNFIDLFEYEVQRGGKPAIDLGWIRRRITLSCDWQMVTAANTVDEAPNDVEWASSIRSVHGGDFIPADGAMDKLLRRYCFDHKHDGDAVAFDKVMAGMRAQLPPPVEGPVVPAKLVPRRQTAKSWTPLPDQHLWELGPSSWRRLDGLSAEHATVFVNAGRILRIADTRSAWVFMVPPPRYPHDPPQTRDAAMRQYKIDCESGGVELVGQTVWWATHGTYPVSNPNGAEGPALKGSLTGQLKEAVCTSKFSETVWPSMDEAYKSVVGRSRWFW